MPRLSVEFAEEDSDKYTAPVHRVTAAHVSQHTSVDTRDTKVATRHIGTRPAQGTCRADYGHSVSLRDTVLGKTSQNEDESGALLDERRNRYIPCERQTHHAAKKVLDTAFHVAAAPNTNTRAPEADALSTRPTGPLPVPCGRFVTRRVSIQHCCS